MGLCHQVDFEARRFGRNSPRILLTHRTLGVTAVHAAVASELSNDGPDDLAPPESLSLIRTDAFVRATVHDTQDERIRVVSAPPGGSNR